MTSETLLRDLATVERLIAALDRRYDLDESGLRDLCWLRARRRFLAGLLRVRRAQRGNKVVSLELWRSGRGAPSAQAAPVA